MSRDATGAPDGGAGADADAQNRRKLSLSTLVVMASTAISRVLGFVRTAVVSAYFGGEGAVDVYNAVWVIPNNLRTMLAEGALSSAFVPVFSRSLVNDPGRGKAQSLIRVLLGLQVVVMVPFLVICVLFADPIVGFILPYQGTQHALAVSLFSWVIHYILLVSISAILMAILNSHSRFAVPALAPLAFSITTILSIVAFSSQLDVFSMAVGVLAGGALQIVLMLPSYRRVGYRFGISFSFRKNDELRQVLRLWGPVVLTASISAINEQIAVFFASSMVPGSQTAMSNALLFWQLPFGIFSASITTVLFPRMARQIAMEQKTELKETVRYGLRMMVYLLVPSSIVLMLLGHELIAVALQRGAFRPEHTELAAQVLWAYSLGLFTVGASRFLQRFFYARHDYRTPLFNGILVVVLDVGLSLLFIRLGLGVSGLAYANTIASVAGFAWLFVWVRRRLGGLGVAHLLQSLLKSLVACMPMIGGVLIGLQFCGSWWRSAAFWQTGLFLVLSALWSAISVLVMYRLLRVEAVDFLMRRKRG